MDREEFVRIIAKSKYTSIAKMVEDGLVSAADAVEVPFGTENVCSVERVDQIKKNLIEAGYKAEILFRAVPSRDTVDYERFLVVRREH